jgi:hypothetical protein
MISSAFTFLLWTFLVSQVQCLFITKDIDQHVLLPPQTTLPASPTAATPDIALPSQPSTVNVVREPLAVITSAPEVVYAKIQKRQPCCFNEQGFRVDCATWTGYYCRSEHIYCNVCTNVRQIHGDLTAIHTKVALSVTETGMVMAVTGQTTVRTATVVRSLSTSLPVIAMSRRP